jgi:hypothetical protein
MEYKVQCRSTKTKRYVESLMPSLIKQLKLENSRRFVLIDISKNAPNPLALGSTTTLPGLDSYVIALRPQKLLELGSTLAHEMIHVKQFAKGQFQIVDGKYFWMGKRVTKRTKYLDQPWEVDAYSKQEIVFRKALE